jgi:hypothetical protein
MGAGSHARESTRRSTDETRAPVRGVAQEDVRHGVDGTAGRRRPRPSVALRAPSAGVSGGLGQAIAVRVATTPVAALIARIRRVPRLVRNTRIADRPVMASDAHCTLDHLRDGQLDWPPGAGVHGGERGGQREPESEVADDAHDCGSDAGQGVA